MLGYYEYNELSVKIDELSLEKKLEFIKFCIKDCIKPEDLISSKILSQIHNNNCEVVDNSFYQEDCLSHFNHILRKIRDGEEKSLNFGFMCCIYYAIASLDDEAVEKAKIKEYLVLIENFK